VESCFLHNRATMNFPDWVIRDFKSMFSQFSSSVTLNKFIVYSNLSYFEKYKEQSVLILGGGPSTLNLDLDNVEYDYLWSCNHFFLNSNLKSRKIDLVMLMAEVDPHNPALIEYRNHFKPYLGFEVHDRWASYKFDNYEKYFAMHTNFYSRLGVGVRMILFAAALGCKHIKFAGLDGYDSIYKGQHAFQPGKKTLPSSFSEELYQQQYNFFWDYCQHGFSNIVFENLGGGAKLHEKIR